MGAASAIRAGSAFVQLYCDSNPLISGLKLAEQKIKNFGNQVGALGAKFAALGGAMWAPILGAARSFAESGTELLLMSQRTGIAVEALSVLQFAAKESGVSVESLEGGLRKMTKVIQDAADGSDEAKQTLASLGLTVRDLSTLTKDQMFERMADGLLKIPNLVTREKRAMEAFGKSAADLLPLLNQGAAGIERFRAVLTERGGIKTLADVQAAFKLQKAFEHAAGAIKAVWNTVGGAVAPLLTMIFEGMVPFALEVKKWAKENKALFNVWLAIGGVILGAGTALIAAAGAIKFVGLALAPLSAAVSLTFGLIGGVASAFFALLTPLGLVVAGIGGAIYGILRFSGEGRSAVSSLTTGFSALGSAFGTTWAGISDAIAAGDWKGAIEIAWLGLQVSFQIAIISLKGFWRNFTAWFVDHFETALSVIGEFIDKLDSQVRTVLGLTQSLTPRENDNRTTGIGVQGEEDERARGLRLDRQILIARRMREHEESGGGPLPQSLQDLIAARDNSMAPGVVTPTMSMFGGLSLGPVARDRAYTGAAGAVAETPAQSMARQRDERRAREREAEQARDNAATAALQAQITALSAKASDNALIADYQRWGDAARAGGPLGPGNPLDQSRAKTDMKGTFSAYAIGGLGATSLMAKSEDLLGRIAGNTNPANNGGLVAS